jgi:hypothetical protein
MKKRLLRWAVGILGALAVVVLLVGLLRYWQAVRLRNITISHQTTYITSPLIPGGGVNYRAWLNAHLSAGVTPSDNAAVWVYDAYGPEMLEPGKYSRCRGPEVGTNFILPGTAFSSRQIRRITQRLGITPANPGYRFISYFQYATEHKWHDLHLPPLALRQPWISEEFPHVAAWLKSQRRALAYLHRAASCTRMYVPIQRGADISISNSAWINFAQSAEILGNAVLCQALLHAGSGNIRGAWRDANAVHKLSLLIDQGQSIDAGLIGCGPTLPPCRLFSPWRYPAGFHLRRRFRVCDACKGGKRRQPWRWPLAWGIGSGPSRFCKDGPERVAFCRGAIIISSMRLYRLIMMPPWYG